ncbi:O-antigen ligase family protein [Duganella callida]|uniref:O-antigen ligase domain-containing protein n=1 Tax=Duganella callida TaxID=2561932 RepID=A0A4Y9S5E6_9BURK|nr:O-antigen ligase family protein [Duganella callida]TFW16410.1 O-antigen ligase domain-containing protein [Duganella callida]
MSATTFSAARKRGKLAGLLAGAMVLLGIVLAAFVVGALIGLDPGTAVRAMVLLATPLVLVLVWAAPKSADDPAARLNLLLVGVLLASMLWPSYVVFSTSGLPGIEPKRMLSLLLLGYWLYKMFTAPVLAQRFMRRWRAGGLPLALLVGFLLWRLASALASEQPVYSFIQYGWSVFNFHLVFFVALSSLRDRRDVAAVMKLLVGGAVLVALLGGVERVVGHNLFSKLVSADNEVVAAALADKLRDGGNRVQATFEHPMVMAEFLMMIVPMAVFLLFDSTRQRNKVAGAVALAAIMAGVLLSGTRSAILTSGAVLGLTLVLYFLENLRGRGGFTARGLLSLIGLIGIITVALAAVPVVTELVQGRNAYERGSSTARVIQYQMGLPKLEKQPVLGYGAGMGNFQVGFKASKGRVSVDSYYLTMALDSGVPGLLLFVGVLLGFIGMGLRLSFVETAPGPRLMARVLAVSLIGTLATRAVLSIEFNLFYMALVCALLLVLKAQRREQDRGAQ